MFQAYCTKEENQEKRGEKPCKKEKNVLRKKSTEKDPESQGHKEQLRTLALEEDRPGNNAKLTSRRFGIILFF